MDAVAYLRVSTDNQTLDQQRKAIEEFCKREGINIVEYFEDPDTSGAIRFLDRKKVKEMIKFCEENNIGTIVLYDISRFGRYDPIDILNDIKRLRDKGISIIFVAEPQIEDPHFRKLWEFIKGWFSEYERIQISTRTRLKINYKIEKGELAFRPTFYHYFASVYFNKDLRDVTKEDVESIKPILKIIIEKALEKGVKKKDLIRFLKEEDKYIRLIYERFPKAPKSYWVIWRLLKDLNIQTKE